MKPRFLTILLLLVAGAVVNVGVAWLGCRGPVMTPDRWSLRWPDTIRLWKEYAPPHWPAPRRAGTFARGRTTTWSHICIDGDELLEFGIVTELQAGWPRRSLCGAFVETMVQPPADWGIWKPRGWILPYQPIWSGFAVNTLLYTVAMSLTFGAAIAPFALRRHLRTRRGLCPACGYPVGESAVCSECGRAVSSRRSPTT